MDISGHHIIGIAYVIWKLYSHFSKGTVTEKKTEIRYIVNGKYIKDTHAYYYLNLLGIDYNEPVSARVIDRAAEKMKKRIAGQQHEGYQVSYDDVEAARLYLLHQWAYFMNKN